MLHNGRRAEDLEGGRARVELEDWMVSIGTCTSLYLSVSSCITVSVDVSDVLPHLASGLWAAAVVVGMLKLVDDLSARY